ncbi:MAG: hypothetical protein JXX14_17050 [Deltaproteobacteria bacterium]|nr:hypothetical protein [Deltaproteobacteria bacterium]
MLVFLGVSFLIYGLTSLRFFLFPEIDPILGQPPQSSMATLVLIGLFFLFGVYGLAMHRSLAAKVFGITVALESAVALSWKILWADAAPRMLRLSGAVEGICCFVILLGLIMAVRKGASIWR